MPRRTLNINKRMPRQHTNSPEKADTSDGIYGDIPRLVQVVETRIQETSEVISRLEKIKLLTSEVNSFYVQWASDEIKQHVKEEVEKEFRECETRIQEMLRARSNHRSFIQALSEVCTCGWSSKQVDNYIKRKMEESFK